MNSLNIPTNGALMSDEQWDALRAHVAVGGSELEKAMLRQMSMMLIGVEAWKRSRDTEWQMRLEVETELREIRVQTRKARQFLSAPLGKLKKADLVKMIEQTLAELPAEPEVE